MKDKIGSGMEVNGKGESVWSNKGRQEPFEKPYRNLLL